MTYPFVRSLLVASTLLACTPALAQNFYAGAAIGQTDVKDACDGIAGTGISCDDSDTAWRAFAGYQFNRNFAVEAGYTNLGEITASLGGLKDTIESTAFDLVGVGLLPVADRFSVYAKLGIYRAETEERSNFGFSADESNNGVTYGFGARYDFGSLGVFAQWQRYAEVGGGDIGESDVDVISAGLLVKF